MNDLEKKDKILAYLYPEASNLNNYSSDLLKRSVFKDGSVSDLEMRHLIECMLKDGILTGKPANFYCDSTLNEFYENSGYVGRDTRRKKEAEHQEAVYQKTKWEGKLAKWQVIAFWIIFPLTIIGSILGIISFFIQKSPVK